MKNEKYLHSELTSKILKAFYQVFNKVGFGFEKRVYVKSLAKALKNLELKKETNKEVSIYFSGDEVGKIKIDIFVDNKVLVKVTNHDEIENREQLQMFLLETAVAQDSIVRIVDAFVDTFQLEEFGFIVKGRINNGAPAFRAADLLKLYY